MGNAGFVIEYPAMHDLAASEDPLLRTLHDLVIHLDPAPHREAFLKPLHTGDSSAFCSTCHKVHLDRPVNDYRWLRGFNSYDNWQASGGLGRGRPFLLLPGSAADLRRLPHAAGRGGRTRRRGTDCCVPTASRPPTPRFRPTSDSTDNSRRCATSSAPAR